jgi:transcriptional regulator with XRE-family HTH domain
MSKETFGQRFARLRKEKGFTQESIAVKLNISPQAVSKWEKDASLPDISLLSDISDLLGVTTDELLGKEKPQTVLVEPSQESNKDISSRLLKIKVTSTDGDRVRVNVPVSLLEIMVNSGKDIDFEGSQYLKKIDFKQIYGMIEKGVIGNLVEVESADGDVVSISVE